VLDGPGIGGAAVGGCHRRSLYAVRERTYVVVRCESCLLPPRCEASSKKTCHLYYYNYCLFCAEKVVALKVSSPHQRTGSRFSQSQRYAHHLPPLENDGVPSRRSGAMTKRHAHAPLAGMHQPRVAHSRYTISVLRPCLREVCRSVRGCGAVSNECAGPSPCALSSARLAC
jgi:hypothetical protein